MDQCPASFRIGKFTAPGLNAMGSRRRAVISPGSARHAVSVMRDQDGNDPFALDTDNRLFVSF